MRRHHRAVALGDREHLGHDDDPGQRLHDVLAQQAAVDRLAHVLGLVSPLVPALVGVVRLAQVRVLEGHAVGQPDRLLLPVDRAVAAGAPSRHVFDDPFADLPAVADAEVLVAVGVDDRLALVEREVHRRSAQGALGQRDLQLGRAHLEPEAQDANFADETLQGVFGGDLTPVDAVGEAAVGIAAAAGGDTHRLLVPLVGHAEGVHQVRLAPEPAVHARFDLPAVLHRDDMSFGRQDGEPQLATPRQVLHVHLVLPAQPAGVRAVIGVATGQRHAVGAGGQEALRARHVGRGLDRDAHVHQGLQALLLGGHELDLRRVVEVKAPVFDAVGQLEELGVVLGEGVGPLACLAFLGFAVLLGQFHPGRTDLHRRVDALGAQQVGELLVRADDALDDLQVAFDAGQRAFDRPLEQLGVRGLVVERAAHVVIGRVHRGVHQHLAARQLALQLLLDARDVDLQHRAGEHAGDDVDQLDLIVRHLGQHLVEDAEHLVDVVGAVDGRLVVDRLGPVEHALGRLQAAFDLALAAVEDADLVEAGTDVVAVQAAGHRQRVVQERRVDAVVVAQDEAVELGVVAQHAVRRPVDLGQLGADALGRHDAGLAAADLDAHHLRLEARVTDVLGRRELGQRVLVVVVGLEVQADQAGPVHLVQREEGASELGRRGERLDNLLAQCGGPAHEAFFLCFSAHAIAAL